LAGFLTPKLLLISIIEDSTPNIIKVLANDGLEKRFCSGLHQVKQTYQKVQHPEIQEVRDISWILKLDKS